MPADPEGDDLLVAQAQRGDAEAFGRLVERHQDALFNGICRMVGQRQDAEDLAQEVFVKAFRNIARFEGRSAFYTWLYSIAVNAVISHRRKAGSRRRLAAVSYHAAGDDDQAIDVADCSALPDVAAEHHELGDRIAQAIAQLDDEQRVVVVLRDIEGFDYETIGKMLGCPQGTVKSRLHRARLTLREQLKDLVA